MRQWGSRSGWQLALAVALAASACNAADARPGSAVDAGPTSGVGQGGKSAAGGAGTSRTASGTDSRSVFVGFNLHPDSSCTYSADSASFLALGLYDLAQGSMECGQPYFLHLQVGRVRIAGGDEREQSDVLQLGSAQVRLMTLRSETLAFGPQDPLPNPFLTTTNAALAPASGSAPSKTVAAVEVIPRAYADQLHDFDGEQILIEVQLRGRTSGDDTVSTPLALPPFVYPVELCNRCLVLCGSGLQRQGLTPEDVADGECADNAGADGRFCLDNGC